jgi:hypothetical protein
MRADETRSMHVAVYALSLLGGAHQKVHTEDVAQKCLEIAPERFKWEKYSYPDKELVRKALFHASEAKNGKLVVGRTGIEQRGKLRDGWQLTPSGAAWVRNNEERFGNAVSRDLPSVTVPKREAERLLKRVQSESAYQVFAGTMSVNGISQYMFTDLLNCSPDASAETIRTKFRRLMSIAELIGDKNVLKFLSACESKFGRLMGPAAAVEESQ